MQSYCIPKFIGRRGQGNLTQLAKVLEVAKGALSKWRAGIITPVDKNREVLGQLYLKVKKLQPLQEI